MIQRLFVGSVSALFTLAVFAAPPDAYTQRDVMQCGGDEVALVSSCRSVRVQDDQEHQLPVCSDQTITFNGKELKRELKRVSQLTMDGASTPMVVTLVSAMGCLKGTKGSLVAIGGHSGCDVCKQWFGYYSTAGELEMFTYGDSYQSFGAKGSKGSSEALMEAYGVTAKDLRGESPEIKKISYGPP